MQELIVHCTNMYAQKWITENEPNGGWFTERWRPIEKVELMGFIGCLLFAGATKAAHESYEELLVWSADIGRPYLYATTSLPRFQNIMKFIRYDDLDTREERWQNDKLAPIRELWELFQDHCCKYYKPSAFLTIDEQLVPFRGRCPFCVYMKSKPDKYGIKIWVVQMPKCHML